MSEVPPPRIQPTRRTIFERVSIVWVVPIGALVISLAIAWQNYMSRGPVIEIAFSDAAGISPGETELRYREVPVGIVEDVGFSEGLQTVVASVRLEQDIAPYVDDGATFWVIRPQVTAQGVTGLSTVLSGAYIEGSWDAEIGSEQSFYVGLGQAPVERPDADGLRITLVSEDGEGLLQGTPILYRGIQVGAVAALRLTDDGQSVLADAFIEAPYDDLVSSTTRFWDASGFSFSLGPQGARLDVSSLAALVSGGVAFENLVRGGEPVEPGTRFELYEGEDAALSSVFTDPDLGGPIQLGIVFEGDVSGLSADAAVEYRGVRIGEVTGVTGYVDEERFGDRRVRLLATVELDPSRLGVTGEATQEEVYDFLQELIDRGVRARLARGSILVGGLKIVLAEVDTPEPASLDTEAEPLPIFPSVAVDLPEERDTAEELLERVNALPIEEVLGGVTTLLANVNEVIGSDAVQAAPEELLGLVSDIRGVVGAEEVQQLPDQVGSILASLDDATQALGDTLSTIEEAGAAEALTGALGSLQATLDGIVEAGLVETANAALAEAAEAAEAIGAATDRLPQIAADVERFATAAAEAAEELAALQLQPVLADVSQAAEAARTLIASEALAELPATVNDAVASLNAAIEDVRAAGLIASAESAISETGEAAAAVEAALADLPALVDEIGTFATAATEVAQDVAALELAALVQEATGLVASARNVVGDPATQGLPGEVGAILTEIDALLASVREAGLVPEATAAVSAAQETATSLAEATAGLPSLVERLDTVVAEVQALPLAATVGAAEDALSATGDLLSAESTQALPAELNAALSDLQQTLEQFRDANVAERAGSAADALAEATVGVPTLVDNLAELAETANTLPVERLGNELADLAEAAQGFVEDAGTADLPEALASTLQEVQAAVAELREGGLIASANATLASARDAAAAIEQATETLPGLAARLDALAQQAENTLAGYDEGSQITRQAQSTLRELQEAARAVSALARAIERNPNSLLLGR